MNETLTKLLGYVRDRLKEPSTYPALILVITAAGYQLTEDQKGAVITMGLIVAGVVGAILPDRLVKNTRAEDHPDKPKENP